MLPAVSARRPAAAIACAMSDVVVVLPLVPGDAHAARPVPQRQKPDIHLGVDLEAGLAGTRERRHVGRYARGHHHGGRPRDALQIVSADLDRGAEPRSSSCAHRS